jgi:hypothetical protein
MNGQRLRWIGSGQPNAKPNQTKDRPSHNQPDAERCR